MRDLSEQERARYVAAMRAKAPPRAEPKAPPTRVAASGAPCGRCGASGLKGCDHYLAYQPPQLTAAERQAAHYVGARHKSQR